MTETVFFAYNLIFLLRWQFTSHVKYISYYLLHSLRSKRFRAVS